jgi:hypothetical protein
VSITNANNGAGSTALALNVPAGHAPMTVNRNTKVVSLNADWLDGIDSSAFLRKGSLATVNVGGAGGVVDVSNPGSGNGVRGRSASGVASGVYGENFGTGGNGVAGRAVNGNGVYGEATGSGRAGYFAGDVAVTGHLNCDGCVAAGNISGPVGAARDAERVDGASIVSNRVVNATDGEHILDVPEFGYFYVYSCEDSLARIGWENNGTGSAYLTWMDFLRDDTFADDLVSYLGSNGARHHLTVQLARATGGASQVAEVSVTGNGTGCVFAAQAVVQPG